MSLRDWLFGTGEDPQGRPTEEALAPLDSAELARIKEASARSVAFSSGERLGAAVDQLIPLGAAWGQAAATRGLAVVKFPEGVTWADLCVRQSDGWNLLSSFNKDTGKFNETAGIRQAGLQPQAVANIALQTAAVAVGMAYMNEINDKLEGLQEGIEEIQRVMERQRDAKLKAGYDALYRLSLNLEESATTEGKFTVGLQAIEDATRAAEEAWNYQLSEIQDLTEELARKKKLGEKEIAAEIALLQEKERRATLAFQLMLIAQQVGMRFESDYTAARIAKNRKIVMKCLGEHAQRREEFRRVLGKKVSKLGGPVLKIADAAEDEGYEAENVLMGVLHEMGRQAARLSPVEMRRKAKNTDRARKALIMDSLDTGNAVRQLAENYEEELEELDFAFNRADTVVIEGGQVRLFATGDAEDAEDKAE